ncbi:MAG: phosphatidylglycerophosphatase A [Patescibacteria group bacterium]|jgi:phosphatidylglycerophosphatase A
MKKSIKFFLSLSYTGLTPKCPGTAGSLATIFFLILLSAILPESLWLRAIILIILLIAAVGLGIYAIKKYIAGECDQQWIVIDEFSGMLIAAGAVFIFNLSLDWYFIAFILFRFFDIIKPLGLGRINKVNKPWAVVADDVIAGIYSLIILILFYYFI